MFTSSQSILLVNKTLKVLKNMKCVCQLYPLIVHKLFPCSISFLKQEKDVVCHCRYSELSVSKQANSQVKT